MEEKEEKFERYFQDQFAKIFNFVSRELVLEKLASDGKDAKKLDEMEPEEIEKIAIGLVPETFQLIKDAAFFAIIESLNTFFRQIRVEHYKVRKSDDDEVAADGIPFFVKGVMKRENAKAPDKKEKEGLHWEEIKKAPDLVDKALKCRNPKDYQSIDWEEFKHQQKNRQEGESPN
ncbi:MAG: hypothetical protein J5736_00215 [Bacilli bacterium]|nr:hypothetical protein [Bacilli bacterium]